MAVIGNLSTSSEYFAALREAGALQRLVRLDGCLAWSNVVLSDRHVPAGYTRPAKAGIRP